MVAYCNSKPYLRKVGVKMKKLAMLLVILALCVPSYGDILVYKVTISGKAILEGAGEFAVIKSITIKGYSVVDLDSENDELIVYGKELDGDKYQRNIGGVLEDLDWWNLEKEGQYAVATWVKDGQLGELALIGTAKLIDIGYGKDNKEYAPSSMAGHGKVWNDPITDAIIMGSGSVTATLDGSLTKTANQWGQDFEYTVNRVEQILNNQGYMYW